MHHDISNCIVTNYSGWHWLQFQSRRSIGCRPNTSNRIGRNYTVTYFNYIAIDESSSDTNCQPQFDARHAVTPLITHWSYCSLALSHRVMPLIFKLSLFLTDSSGLSRLIAYHAQMVPPSPGTPLPVDHHDLHHLLYSHHQRRRCRLDVLWLLLATLCIRDISY